MYLPDRLRRERTRVRGRHSVAGSRTLDGYRGRLGRTVEPVPKPRDSRDG